MSENEDIFHEEILKVLLKKQKIYIIVKTLFTIHHIEKLLGSVRDRGRWKWIAETDMKAFDKRIFLNRIAHILTAAIYFHVFTSMMIVF